jgi:predicted N-formylglutamate amidohydrolase
LGRRRGFFEEQELPLLQPGDPPPFSVINPEGKAPVLMLCDHASKAVPQSLDQLGLSDWELSQHVGWDIGAAETAGHIARALDAPLVQSGYSRLVIDCNRRLDNPMSIPPISDKIVIPGNRDLSPVDRAERAEACFWPYHREVAKRLDDFVARGVTPSIVIVHSFTPEMNGFKRPWHVGVLWDGDTRIAPRLLDGLRRRDDIHVGDNEPYSGKSENEFTLTYHTLARDLPRVSLEIRQDLIGDSAGCRKWARMLIPAFGYALRLPGYE